MMKHEINQMEAALKAARRDEVITSYESAKAMNRRLFLEGNHKATSEYIYYNQSEDGHNIIYKYYINKRRIISVNKRTKIGADGLMIEVLKLITTHPDDNFVCNPADVRILTGMSNIGWQNDMIDKVPSCFKDKIFHHGKLKKSDLKNIRNSLIIIDEIDSGDKEWQVLHTLLNESGILNVQYMNDNNIYLLIISATIIKELHDTFKWGELHESYSMIIPDSYIGHDYFLKEKIIQEWYSLNNKENIEKWINTDIIENYNRDYRVHIVRLTEKQIKLFETACDKHGIRFICHTSDNKLEDRHIDELFNKPLTSHYILAVKNLLRRANLIPDKWKIRIGAMHELFTKKVDNNVQTQGLLGRMCGYGWIPLIEQGHKIGPYRTSIRAIEEYENTFKDPFGQNSYSTAGFTKNSKGQIKSTPTMLSPQNIEGLIPIPLPTFRIKGTNPINIINITEEEKNDFKNITHMWEIIKNYDEEVYNKYKHYITHFWKMDTQEKCEKWCLNTMIKENAYSSEVNIKSKDKKNNILMIYLHENRLIISAWTGAEL